MRRLSLAIVTLALGWGLWGCSASPVPDDDPRPSAPPPYAPSPELGDFFMRQTLRVDRDGQTRQIDAVVQYDEGVVTTVLLTPVGKPAVILRQRGAEVDVSGPAVDRVPFDLRWIAHDIGLALLVSPLQVDGRHGEHVHRPGSGPIVDQWRDGRLTERTAEASQTTITYDWASESDCPDTIHVRNLRFGYSLTVTSTQCRMERST